MILRVLFRCSTLLILIFALLALAAPALGETEPADASVQGFIDGCKDKPQPCWFGVIPGRTTEQEIYHLLAFIGRPPARGGLSQGISLVFTLPEPSPYCHAIFYVLDGVVLRGELSLCRAPEMRVGDLAALLENGTKLISLPPEELVYGGVSMNINGWPALFSHVSYVTMFAPDAQFQTYPFFGFLTKHRYCQLVPYYPPCP